MFVTVIDEQGAAPLNCRQCREIPCAAVCPTQAIQMTDDGVVQVRMAACIACGFCVVACPFGVIQINALEKQVRKCDLCIHRLKDGLAPVCVLSCPSRALRFEESETFAGGIRQQAVGRFLTAMGSGGLISTIPESLRKRR